VLSLVGPTFGAISDVEAESAQHTISCIRFWIIFDDASLWSSLSNRLSERLFHVSRMTRYREISRLGFCRESTISKLIPCGFPDRNAGSRV